MMSMLWIHSQPISAATESEIANLDDEDKKAFLDDMGMEEPGLTA